MINSQLTVTKLENAKDVQSYRDSTGVVLAVDSYVVQGILNDVPEGIRYFSTLKEAKTYVNDRIFNEAKPVKPATKSTGKGKKAVSEKDAVKAVAKKRGRPSKK